MKIEFCDPDRLPFEALKALEAGCKKTDNNLWEIIDSARREEGSLYILHDDGVKGVLYFEVCQNILNLALMSCPDAMKYKELIPQFVKDLMKNLNIQTFCIVSRTGWNRLFKDLTPVGMIYTYTQD